MSLDSIPHATYASVAIKRLERLAEEHKELVKLLTDALIDKYPEPASLRLGWFGIQYYNQHFTGSDHARYKDKTDAQRDKGIAKGLALVRPIFRHRGWRFSTKKHPECKRIHLVTFVPLKTKN